MRAPPARSSHPGEFTEPLRWPAFVDAGQPVTMRMVSTAHHFSAALPAVPTLAYQLVSGQVVGAGSGQETYLGPTLVVPTGVPSSVTVGNLVDSHPLGAWVDTALHGVLPSDATHPRTAVHLHGGNTRPAFDGGPLDVFDRGQAVAYQYENAQDAAGLWYHDHALGITRLNVHAGLAAGYLVRDTPGTGIDTGDGVVLPAPPYEIPLVLQDRSFVDGAMVYAGAPGTWSPEQFGDVPVVNGVAWPYLDVEQGLYRFRVYNGANARVFDLSLMVGRRAVTFFQIGSDGGLLDRPVPTRRLLLTPGERADLLVDFRGLAGATVVLVNSAPAPYPNGGDVALPHLMQLRVLAAVGSGPASLPGTLRPAGRVRRLDRLAATAPVRTHTLVEVMSPEGEVLTGLLNNRAFHDESYQEHPVRPGSLEVWELVNLTGDLHPIHLHLVQFQVLSRAPIDVDAYVAAAGYAPHGDHIVPGAGVYPAPPATPFVTGPAQPPAPHETGWKDTVASHPGTVTRIAVPFGDIGVPTAARNVHVGDYVWHCHILDHEDNDMMQRYRIAEH